MSTEVDEPVHVEEWDEAWQSAGDAVKAECREALGIEALGLEHVGSTAVRGLSAKPSIDVLAGVPPGHRTAVAQRLATHGWTHLGEAGVPGREYLRRRVGQHANVHVVEHVSRLLDEAKDEQVATPKSTGDDGRRCPLFRCGRSGRFGSSRPAPICCPVGTRPWRAYGAAMVSRISHTTVDCRDAYVLSEWWNPRLHRHPGRPERTWRRGMHDRTSATGCREHS